MKHTDTEIEEAANRFESLADGLDPATVEADDISDLRAVGEAAEQVRRDEALVTERVAAARAHGRSWNRIPSALGISRQAARQRFADKVS
jgi:3-dehydroquinate synthase class II